MQELTLYGCSVVVLGGTCTMFASTLYRWLRWPRCTRLRTVPGDRGLARPVHPFTRDEPRFESAW